MRVGSKYRKKSCVGILDRSIYIDNLTSPDTSFYCYYDCYGENQKVMKSLLAVSLWP